MLELYTIISSILLSITSLLFFVKWRMETKDKTRAELDLELSVLLSSAALGGYYYWDSDGEEEIFSDSLIKIFGLRHEVRKLDQFAKLFEKDKEILMQMFLDLKVGKKDNFLFNSKAKVFGDYKYFQCYGNRIDDSYGNVKAIIIWFYDTSEYVTQIKDLTIQNRDFRKENEIYESILNSISMPIWKRNEDFAIDYCNAFYKKFLDSEKQGGKEGFVQELDESLKKLSKTAYNQKRNLNIKKHLVMSGERRFFDVSEARLVSDNGVVGFASDITRQEEIEMELERHISAHADLLESSSSAMAIYGPDTRLKFYNNSFMTLWNLKEKWLNGNPTYGEVLELLRERRQLPEQANFTKFRNQQMELFNELTSPHNEFFHLPDGKALRVIVIPHALGGLLFAYEDMTDRFAMERSYNTLIAVQKETLDNLREGIIVFGRDGVLKLYNPTYAEMWPDEADILDKKPHSTEMMELSKKLFNYGNDWEGFKKYWTVRPDTKEPILRRTERTDGKVIEKLIVPLPDGDFLISYVDVTSTITAERRLRERNEALEEADRLKTEFLANVSYELRTPLTSIIGFAEVLEGNHFGKLNRQQIEYVHGIYDSSMNLMSIINDILDLASIEAGYMVLDKRDIDVFRVIASVVKLLRERCRDSELSLSIECAKDVGKIHADERRIKQVLFNIIGNSIKFTDKGGSIVVGAKVSSKNNIVIWVEDTGIGIPKDDRKKVFDRFFKSKASLSMKKSGTGLGLSVVKNIVKLHGGKIKLESEQGKGTKISCVFEKVE